MLPYTQKLPSGAWRYRRPVPDRLKPIVAKDNLVKKLGKTYAEALAAYAKVHADFERTLRKAEEILMAETEPKDLPILTKLELYLEGITKVRRMGFDPHNTLVDRSDPESVAEDHARLTVADMILEDYPVDPSTGDPAGVTKMDEFVVKALYGGAPAVPEPTLEDAKKLYIAERVTGTETEIKKKVQRLDRVTGYIEAALGRPPTIPRFSRSDAKLVRDHMLSGNLKPSSVKRDLNVVKAMFNHIITEMQLAGCMNPFAKLPIAGLNEDPEDELRDPLPDDILQSIRRLILNSANDDLQFIWRLLEGTGCRLAEVTGLRVEDITLNAYTTEKDRDFGEAFFDAVDFLGKSDDQALDFAIKVAQPIDASGQESLAKYQQQIDSEVNELASRKNWFGIEADSAPSNLSTVRTKVSQLAGKMVAAGLPPKDAIEMAAKSIKKRSTVHNGTVLFLQGLDVPDNFGDVADEALAEFMVANPKVLERSGLDPEDLTLVPLGGNLSGGRFVIANRENTIDTLRDDAGNVAVVTLAGLREVAGRMAERQQQDDKRTLRQSVFEGSARQKGLVYARDADGSLSWVHPDTREVYDFQFTEKDDAPVWKKTGKRYRRGNMVKEDGSFVLKGSEDGKFWGRLRGSDLKKHREEMKKWSDDHDAAAAERRKFFGSWLPSIKIGDTVLND